MEDYVKYDELKEKVDKFKLTELGIDSRIRNDFYAHYNDLQSIRAIEEANGTLTEEEQSTKEAYMRAIDIWIANFIEERKKNVEQKVADFENEITWLLNKLQELKAMFALNDIVVEEVNQIVQGIDKEFEGLIGQATELRDELDNLRELAKGYTEGLDFTTTYVDIMKKLNNLKDKIKEIKKDQIAKYNANVKSTNVVIEKTKSEFADKEGLSDDVLADLTKLELLDECTYSLDGKAYNNKVYMDHLDYDKLKQMLLLLNQIREKTKEPAPPEEVDLEADMKYIEDKLMEIEGKIKDEMTMDEINPLLDGLAHVGGKITEFEIKLKANKEKISEEKYNEFVQRVEAARKKLEELRKKLFERIPNLYKALSAELESLNKDVSHLEFYVDALFGKVTEAALTVYEERLDFYEGTLNEIKDKIEKAKESGKLEDNQYTELQKRVDEIEKKLKKIRSKIKDPKVIAEADIFAFLNKRIDGVEEALDKLETEIDALEKPIKDRNIRKQLDAIIAKLEDEIKDIGQQLERYKDEDPEKYEATKERLDAANERLNKISKKYRSKCPLLVRAVKGAKDFYKKHKKIVLIAAGLAAIALIHATVGPILIPAIMHGNLMIGATTPALRGFTMFANNILGGLIGATKNVHGIWALANGVIINPNVAATSLLKGVAISGIGSTLMVAPVVVAVKKLIDKMKTSNLKQKLTEGFEKGKEKVKNKPKKEKKPKTKKAGRKTEDEIVQLFRKYKKSGKTIEEFCEEEELTEDDKMILQLFEERYKKNVEAEKEAGRKGRR